MRRWLKRLREWLWGAPQPVTEEVATPKTDEAEALKRRQIELGKLLGNLVVAELEYDVIVNGTMGGGGVGQAFSAPSAHYGDVRAFQRIKARRIQEHRLGSYGVFGVLGRPIGTVEIWKDTWFQPAFIYRDGFLQQFPRHLDCAKHFAKLKLYDGETMPRLCADIRRDEIAEAERNLLAAKNAYAAWQEKS